MPNRSRRFNSVRNSSKVKFTKSPSPRQVSKVLPKVLTVKGLIFALTTSALLILFLYWIFTSLSSFFLYVIAAFVLAVSLDPLITFLGKYVNRSLATGIVFSSGTLLVSVFVLFFGNVFFNEFLVIADTLPTIFESFLVSLQQQFPFLNIDPEFLEKVSYADISLMFLPTALTFITGFANIFIGIILIFVFAWYFAYYNPVLKVSLTSALPSNRQNLFAHAWQSAISSSGKFLFSKIILASLSSFFHVVAFGLLDAPYWLIMGVFAGVTSQFIPVFGTYIGVIVPAFFAFQVDPLTALWVVVFAIVYQQIENYVFTPKIASKVLKINSGVALASTIVGFILFGPIGALLGMPIVTIALSVYAFYKNPETS